MNKQDAANLLGVTPRTLESYVKAGRVPVSYVRGKTRPVADFEESELQRLKSQLEAPVNASALVLSEPRGTAIDTLSQFDVVSTLDAASSEVSKETARAALVALARLAGVEAGDNGALVPGNATSVGTADKLLLTLAEAQALTGLSRGVLRAAIGAKELKARQIGRAWRIKRADLERFVEAL